jgi:hypothetical protein
MGLAAGLPLLLPWLLREPREAPLPWLRRLSEEEREEAREQMLSVSEPSASNMLPSAMALALLAWAAAALGVTLRPCCWLPAWPWWWCTTCQLSGMPGWAGFLWLLEPACWRLLLVRWPPFWALAGCSLRVQEL